MTKARQLADLGNAYSDGALSNRNLIINGAMQVAQRGTSATHAATGSDYIPSADRWVLNIESSAGSAPVSVDVSSDAPSGFASSLYISPDASYTTLGTGNRILLQTRIEGFDVQRIGFATTNPQPVTLSFWIKSNLTGVVTTMLGFNSASSSLVCHKTTISSANTWEHKVVTFPAGTLGTAVPSNNQIGLAVSMWFAAGPAFYGSYAGDGVYTNDAVASYTDGDNINLFTSTSNYVNLTGVQLEVGDTATPFEHRSYGQELALCQRYTTVFNDSVGIWGIGRWETSAVYVDCTLPVQLRTFPTVTMPSNNGVYAVDPTVAWYQVQNFAGISTNSVIKPSLSFNMGGAYAANKTYTTLGMYSNSGAGQLIFDAEL